MLEFELNHSFNINLLILEVVMSELKERESKQNITIALT